MLCTVLVSGCALSPRRPPSPDLISNAVPDGFSTRIRLYSVDRRDFARELPQILIDLRRATKTAPAKILALSGGGVTAAFGAGALIGLTEANTRPNFTIVTGVSAGALIAPFAFLGSSWDQQLRHVFASGRIERLGRAVSRMAIARRILFPNVAGSHGPLAELVDQTYTDAMVDAVGREAASGRKLIVATTNLDSQETVLWDMTAIAAHGGAAAHDLFRKVLVASASVPGVFPPVLIRVHEGGVTYDEMHVDGSVTTPLFILPLIAPTVINQGLQLEGGTIYVIVNGRLAMTPVETPVNTLKELAESFSAQLTYKTRDAVVLAQGLAYRSHMQFRVSSIPVGYPAGNFLDFHQKHIRQLFSYGESCAAQGLLWTSVAKSIERNIYRHVGATASTTACPGSVPSTSPKRADSPATLPFERVEH
ncbi:MAG TPA: patatin-like phospholipase family protein [Rhodanobacteraceae bacterium]|nr:patatin-like phospholipase family protein [Rhodanobacteraceae bacterium]